MAGEIQLSYETSKTVYAVIRNAVGQVWNNTGSAFETYATANYADYVISMTEQGTASAFYAGNFPTAIAAGIYSVVGKEQLGGSAAETDPTISDGVINWNGSASFPLSDLVTSGQIGQGLPITIYRGQMIRNFPVKMVSAADHVTPLTSGVISGQISRDGGSFGALESGTLVAGYNEMGRGWYSVNLTSGDMLGNTIALSFAGVSVSGVVGDQRDLSIITQRVSGQVA